MRIIVVAWWMAMVAVTARVRAQDSTHMRSSVLLQVDNDLFSLRGAGPPPDYDYTHGTRFALALPARRPAWLIGGELGQEIYTPRHNVAQPTPGDRPYGAWIFGTACASRVASAGVDSLSLRLGVTGPPALGEEVQNSVHRLLGNHLEQGWSHQIPTHVALAASYDATHLLLSSETTSHLLAGSVGAVLGTLRRDAHASVLAYWSFGRLYAPVASAPLVRHPRRWYVSAGYRQYFVAHDTFIEGDEGAAGAVRVPWVSEAFGGAGVRFSAFAIGYRYVLRGREYRSEPGTHAYGSIGIAALLH